MNLVLGFCPLITRIGGFCLKTFNRESIRRNQQIQILITAAFSSDHVSCRHTHNTRYASKQNFCKPRPRTNTGKQTFSYQAIDLWRDIPYYLKDLNTFSFAKEIKHYLYCQNNTLRNLNSNLSFLITSIGIICSLSLLLFFLFFFLN